MQRPPKPSAVVVPVGLLFFPGEFCLVDVILTIGTFGYRLRWSIQFRVFPLPRPHRFHDAADHETLDADTIRSLRGQHTSSIPRRLSTPL
jgi:hypothetical protein